MIISFLQELYIFICKCQAFLPWHINSFTKKEICLTNMGKMIIELEDAKIADMSK